MGHQRTKIKRRISSNTARHSKKEASPAKPWSVDGLIGVCELADVPVLVRACACTEVPEEQPASLRAWGETSVSRHVAQSTCAFI